MTVSPSQLPSGRDGGTAASPATGLGARPNPLQPDLEEPAGFTLARHAIALVVVIAGARFLHASATPAWALVAVVTVWALSTSASWATPIAGAGLSWLLATGFIEHRTGELSLASADRGHALVLAVAALVALVVRVEARASARAAGSRG